MDRKKAGIIGVVTVLLTVGIIVIGKEMTKQGPADVQNQGADKNTQESVSSDNKTNGGLNDQKDQIEAEDASMGDIPILGKISQSFSEAKFSQQMDGSFEWQTESDPISLQGKSIEAAGVAAELSIDSFFKKEGFKESKYNYGAGAEKSTYGYYNGKIVCLYDEIIGGGTVDDPETDDFVYDIEISCAKSSLE